MVKNNSKKLKNTEKDYQDALATADPTKISDKDLTELAKESIRKFKSLS